MISAALCYYLPAREPEPGEGRLARYTWADRYAELREKLDELGRRLGGDYRVLVDANEHVDREGAARAGVGFYGKNTLLITSGTARGSCSGRSSPTSRSSLRLRSTLDCGSCTLCIDACPTGALDEPGTLDSTRCLSYWTQAPASIPEDYRAELGALVYGCDICQDVCPWNRGIEKRRAGEPLAAAAEPTVSLVEWLEADGDELVERYDRLYVPRNDPRFLRRNALVAAGNVGGAAERAAVAPFADGDDPLLREHAEWALARIDERSRRMKLLRALALVRLALVPLALLQLLVNSGRTFRPATRPLAWELLALQALVAVGSCSARIPLAAAHAAPRAAQGRRRLDPHLGPRARLLLGAGPAAAVAALPRRARGGALLPPARRTDRGGVDGAGLRGGGARGANPSSASRAQIELDRAAWPDRVRARRGSSARSSSSSAARRSSPRSVPRRRSGSATTSAAGSTSSRRRTARPARSAPRSTSTRRSRPSPRSCAASCPSIARRSCWSRATRRA